MTDISKNKIVRIQAEPEVDKDLSNATKLRDEMRSELRRVQDNKSDIAKHQPRGSQ